MVLDLYSDSNKVTFSLEKAILWSHILAGSNDLKCFSLHKMLIDGLELCGVLVDYCDVFISSLDSHSEGTHSLQRIHC